VPVSANSIVSQLVKNGAHETGSRKSRLTNKELSDLRKIPTPEGNSISCSFAARGTFLLPSGA